MPFKDFVAGQPLAAADVDNYLMRQTVMVFASEAARDTALTGVLDEGMVTFQEDSNRLTYYTGSAWAVLSEPPQSWTLAAAGQPGPVSATTNYGWKQRSNGIFSAQLKITFTAAGVSGNNIVLGVPYTLADALSIGGTFAYYDAGNTVFTGAVWPVDTTLFALQCDREGAPLGQAPAFAIASGDYVHVSIHGAYA